VTLGRSISVLIVAAAAGCGPSISGRIDDGTITTRVRTALLYDADLAPARLGVLTVEGVVTLSGTLRSDDQVARAIEVARSVDGVRDVISKLVVVGRYPHIGSRSWAPAPSLRPLIPGP